jgi:hypothetical protein
VKVGKIMNCMKIGGALAGALAVFATAPAFAATLAGVGT